MYGIYLIAVLVVTGGAIAFIGDRLGTKIGKKRLSIFGLRPRHTSNVITVITGFVITALTIGITSVASEDVRTAFFGMEKLNATLVAKQNELENLSGELATAKSEYQKANDDLQNSKSEIDNLHKEQLKLQEESDRLKIEGEKLQLDNAKLFSDNEQLLNNNNRLSQENQNLTSNNDRLSKNNEDLIKNNSELAKNNDQLKNDNDQLEERNKNLRDGLVAIREGDIVFRAGEILASGVISKNQNADEIVADIDKMAELATANVSRRIGNDGEHSVWIYQPELSEAVKAISESDQDVVLRIAAAGNLMRGEPVRTSLELYKNNKIFDKDEFIFSKSYDINENVSVEEIVQSFLNEVNRSAVSKGVLADPISGAVGVVEGSQIYQIVNSVNEAINKSKTSITLSAYARDVTTAIGPLRLIIKVENTKKGLNI